MAVLSDARPAGRGPQCLAPPTCWPNVPVLLQGSAGTGRTTWANWLMAQHQASHQLVVCSEASKVANAELFNWLSTAFLIPSSSERWVSLKLDTVSRSDQNILLRLSEDLPENCHLIFRATGTSIIPALRSRCFVINVQPPSYEDTVRLLEARHVSRAEAEELAELRPGRPGLALALSEQLPLRSHMEGVLNAADARDWTAMASSLLEVPEGVRMWFAEWVRAAMANKPWSHPRLAREVGVVGLVQCEQYLNEVRSPRLAVRAAATVLATRP